MIDFVSIAMGNNDLRLLIGNDCVNTSRYDALTLVDDQYDYSPILAIVRTEAILSQS